MEKRFKSVHPNESTLEEMNQAISIPTRLHAEDGRRLVVQTWVPAVDIEHPIHADIRVRIELPEDDQ